ncbi:MAG: hypothetical protein WC787_02790 [Patescibacteria group bacterium]
MMMPFRIEDPVGTIPEEYAVWRKPIEGLCAFAPRLPGVAYLTIDEAEVEAGETHRRPGLHVDGIGPDGRAGGWGGGWGAKGMIIASSHLGCRAYSQEFRGWPKPNGDCAHLAEQCDPGCEVPMVGGHAYWLEPLTVHEPLLLESTTRRQFVRISMPSDAPWYEGYTINSLGIKPTGPIHPARSEFMAHRT